MSIFQVMSLLVVLVLSLIITRVATIALMQTGLTRESARFQARSALTGAGFTTNESEKVVNHPIRRRVVMWLMLVGNCGLVLVAALLNVGNVLLLYGRDTAIKSLDEREAGATGDFAHVEAVAEHKQQAKQEKAEDTESGAPDDAAESGVDAD